MRKLIGFIPSPSKGLAFGIPLYQNDKGCLEYHKLDKVLKTVIDFEKGPEEKPSWTINLPEPFQKVVKVGDPAIFAINDKHFLFIGAIKDLMSHVELLKKIGGKNFIEELNLVL